MTLGAGEKIHKSIHHSYFALKKIQLNFNIVLQIVLQAECTVFNCLICQYGKVKRSVGEERKTQQKCSLMCSAQAKAEMSS